MGCCSSPRPFKLIVDGKERIVVGLDQIVFSTILSFPSDDQVAGKALWDGLRSLNPEINEEEAEGFKKVLLNLYHQAKKAYGVYESNAKEE